MDKVMTIIMSVLKVIQRVDVSFSMTLDGKIKLCLIFDPKDVVKWYIVTLSKSFVGFVLSIMPLMMAIVTMQSIINAMGMAKND